MTSGAWIAVGAVALALAFGLWRLGTDGRFRGTHVVRRPGAAAAAGDAVPDDATVDRPAADLVAALGEPLGERATLLQVSSAFCAP